MHTKTFFSGILAILCLAALVWTFPAGAATISGVITGDDAYVLYFGDESGSNLTPITSGNWWLTAQSFPNLDVPDDSYLYVLAWNVADPSETNPQAWLGQFTLPGRTLYSNLDDWVFKYNESGNPSYPGNSIPDVGTLRNIIQNGVWQTAAEVRGVHIVVSSSDNMSLNGETGSIWTTNLKGPIPGISTTEAYWIWWDHFTFSDSQDGYALFRSAEPVAPVPIPGSVLLVGTGLVGLWIAGRKGRRS